jgi:hypothetical protein
MQLPKDDPAVPDKTHPPLGRCIVCGYDLRGLNEDAACPECGRSAIESRQAATLRTADPKWLSRLALGATLTAVPIVLGAAVSAILLYDSLPLRVVRSLPYLPTRLWYRPLIPFVALIDFVALWIITTASPPNVNEDAQESIRRCLRFLAICNILCFVALQWLRMSNSVLRAWAIADNLLAAAILWLFWTYAARWAECIPSEPLARRSRSIRSGKTVGLLAGTTLGWVLYRNPLVSDGFRIFGALPGHVIYLVYASLAPVVLLSLAARTRQLRDATSRTPEGSPLTPARNPNQ